MDSDKRKAVGVGFVFQETVAALFTVNMETQTLEDANQLFPGNLRQMTHKATSTRVNVL
ncbi:hypothetical protein PTH_1967 [Pelotomaculum thermopropionicum SI]|uniref:Uncharacterized protein n=1 Tax=Pelotomaculum thermopropionicum (strain DSM 13744 / JCM 10971 / SI) TaxID=370438 RepID=A5D0S6_PELTS|nr:hypothetical protein PTH_1967 [Pelotomaculum thermopropionicum SI]